MNELSELRLGVIATLVSLGLAAVVGLIAVIDANSAAGGVGRGVGTAVIVFVAGATIAVAIACLGRGLLRWVALAAVVAAGVTIDLFTIALWRNITSEAYGKVAGIGLVWALVALIALGLALAVGRPAPPAAVLYGSALGAAAVAGVVTTWLIVTAGNVLEGPSQVIGNGSLLRVLGAALVLLATLWFSALAASRLQRAAPTG